MQLVFPNLKGAAARRQRAEVKVGACVCRPVRRRSCAECWVCWPHVQSWLHQDAVIWCAGTLDTYIPSDWDVQVGPEDGGDTSSYMCLHTDVQRVFWCWIRGHSLRRVKGDVQVCPEHAGRISSYICLHKDVQ